MQALCGLSASGHHVWAFGQSVVEQAITRPLEKLVTRQRQTWLNITEQYTHHLREASQYMAFTSTNAQVLDNLLMRRYALASWPKLITNKKSKFPKYIPKRADIFVPLLAVQARFFPSYPIQGVLGISKVKAPKAGRSMCAADQVLGERAVTQLHCTVINMTAGVDSPGCLCICECALLRV